VRVVGTIEARMGSRRLPGKTLTEIYDGMPLLECVVRRFQLAAGVADVVVATTTAPADDAIAKWCTANGVSVCRGSEDDVLDRVASAASHHQADAIVQMGADSAYLDYRLIDELVEQYQDGEWDYVCNDLPLTYPLGIYAHVVSVPTVVELNRRPDLSDHDREDVVRYIFERPDQFRIRNIEAPPDFRHPELRLTVDYQQDLDLARNLYRHFGGYRFTTADVIALYRQSPALFADTRNLVQRSAPCLPRLHEA
jgi:spore coat polysaccharide biosynthesis protein SpsF